LPDAVVYLSDEGGPDWSYLWTAGLGERYRALRDGDRFAVGRLEVRATHTPGHTPEHLAFVIVDAATGTSEPMGLVSGDFVFVGDLGRPDLLETAAGQTGAMEPSARRLWASAQSFLELPDHLQIWPGHGAGSACGKALGAVPQTTVGYERRTSPALAAAAESEERFVTFILSGQPEPPPYFARMKRLNREGPPLLDTLPRPRPLAATDLAALAGSREVTVIDTRADRRAFAAAHLPGSIWAPLDRSFPTLVGSYVDPGLPVVPLVEGARLEEVVRDLVRIGYDLVPWYATPQDLSGLPDLAVLQCIDFDEMERRRRIRGTRVLDVRGAGEWEAGHVPGALRIAHTRLAPRRGELPPGEEILVHCASGLRAGSAVSWLLREGFRAVHIDGSFSRWMVGHPDEVRRGAAP
jgi:hydroxyacylglutathione hydrolase